MSSWTQREGCAAKFVPLEAPFLTTARSRHVTDRGAPEASGEEGGDSRRDGGNLRAALGGHEHYDPETRWHHSGSAQNGLLTSCISSPAACHGDSIVPYVNYLIELLEFQ
ncbi:hypothetical protein E2I00_011566 [Balaenoptera physalus]|uniref:Uncharacterized protein n=1 Tax=Balaenoptera physalus TaxID=9770 RepID=A0A643C1P4_BALPH|nr:hypothetical protein E2I00_011566 [Balaenoptera physalus]